MRQTPFVLLRKVIWQTSQPHWQQRTASWAAQSVAFKSQQACQVHSDAHGYRSGWAGAAAAGVAAVALGATTIAQGEAFSEEPARTQEQLRAEFMAWMEQQGGHMRGVALETSSHDPAAGHSLVTTPHLRDALRQRWLGRRIGAVLTGQYTVAVADVPLDLALTAGNAVQDPDLGALYAELIQLGLLDDRSAVVAMLAVERVRGAESRYAPWLRLLPTRCAVWGSEQWCWCWVDVDVVAAELLQ